MDVKKSSVKKEVVKAPVKTIQLWKNKDGTFRAVVAPKYFAYVFAQDGDTLPVPNVNPGDDSVNYDEGFTPPYQLNLIEYPDTAKPMSRLQFNQLLKDVTAALQQYQQMSTPYFITSDDNGGTPYAYAKYNTVLYNDGTNGLRRYESLKDNNTDLPSVLGSWAILLPPGDSANVLTVSATTTTLSLPLAKAINLQGSADQTVNFPAMNTTAGTAQLFQPIDIYNAQAHTATLLTSTGGTIISLAPNQVARITLIANGSAPGTWVVNSANG